VSFAVKGFFSDVEITTNLKRRDFLSKCFKAGAAGCAFLYGNKLFDQDPVKAECEKELWKNYPKFKENVLEAQQKYLSV